jgi:hypothetical protein
MWCAFLKILVSNDMLQEAEISSSISTGASRNLEAAQRRGSTILNLKCIDAQVFSFFFFTFILCDFCYVLIGICEMEVNLFY